VTILLDPDVRPDVEHQKPGPESVLGRIMKTVRHLARFAYELLNDLF
jgi:hypothetical protein